MWKRIIISLVLIVLIVNIGSAANKTADPFSPGNAKTFWDNADSEFQNNFIFAFGLFWFFIGAFIFACFGGSAASYSAHKSGQFTDPERKSGGATSMIAIIFIVLGLIICLCVAKPIFGF